MFASAIVTRGCHVNSRVLHLRLCWMEELHRAVDPFSRCELLFLALRSPSFVYPGRRGELELAGRGSFRFAFDRISSKKHPNLENHPCIANRELTESGPSGLCICSCTSPRPVFPSSSSSSSVRWTCTTSCLPRASSN